MSHQTPSQTVGPFFHFALISGAENVLVADGTIGRHIFINGRVTDGEGAPVPDAMIEIWQADARGYFNHPEDPNHDRADRHFRGFGRSDTDSNGTFSFKTVKPGAVRCHEFQIQAPHINVRLFARGMLTHAYTRLYFCDEEDANRVDPVLNLVDGKRRPTLIALHQENETLPTYRFDIALQGELETVFFDP